MIGFQCRSERSAAAALGSACDSAPLFSAHSDRPLEGCVGVVFSSRFLQKVKKRKEKSTVLALLD